VIARLPVGGTAGSVLWVTLVLAASGWWVWRVRAAAAAGDERAALALTGILGCLISPVTWVHHCVWLIPALVRCVDAGEPGPNRRPISFRGVATLNPGAAGPLLLAGSAYLLMTAHLVWLWEQRPPPPLGFLGGNLYVWFSLALLIWTPLLASRSLPAHELDRMLARPL
jgi:alpha-1,2-mannosyltransferase